MAMQDLDPNAIGGKNMTGEFDSRLTLLERHAISTEKRLDGVDLKLDAIMNAVTRAESKPQFNPAAIISFVKDAAILIGLAAAAIVYVASAHVGADLALLNYKVGQLSSAPSATWKAEVESRDR